MNEEDKLASMFELAEAIRKFGSVGEHQPKKAQGEERQTESRKSLLPSELKDNFDEARLHYTYGL